MPLVELIFEFEEERDLEVKARSFQPTFLISDHHPQCQPHGSQSKLHQNSLYTLKQEVVSF